MKRSFSKIRIVASFAIFTAFILGSCEQTPYIPPIILDDDGDDKNDDKPKETIYSVIDAIELDESVFNLKIGESVNPEVSIYKKETRAVLDNSNYEIIYESDYPEVATYIDGVIEAISEGDTNITVRIKLPQEEKASPNTKLYFEAAIHVRDEGVIPPEPTTAIQITPSGTQNVQVNKTLGLSITPTPLGSNPGTIIWTTDNVAIASVSSNGIVTGKVVGSTIIRAATVDNALTSFININVTEPPAPKPTTAISISPSGTQSVKVNKTLNFTVTPTPTDSNPGTIIWTIDNDSIATVSSSGVVTGRAVGTTVVRAATAGNALTSYVNINVTEASGEAKEDMFGGYYASIKGLKGSALKSTLTSIVKKSYSPSYDWSRYQSADEHPTETNSILCIYSRLSYAKNKNGGNANNGEWNREHTFPQSKISSEAAKDNHHIFASDIKLNSYRGNDQFGTVSGSTYLNDELGRKSGCKTGGGYFEPVDAAKGEVARSTMYLVIAYTSLNITTNFKSLDLCFNWHETFAVTPREERRNNVVQGLQKNRNPFIDFPELARMCFDSSYTGPGAFLD